MPTVLGNKGKLSSICRRLLCATQVTGSEFRGCSEDIRQDMTQSWPPQQPSAGGLDQRFLYNQKEAKQLTTQHKQWGEMQQVRTSQSHVAPHKSMLADDLKLSSDEEDVDKEPELSASWADNNSVSDQHTHGREVRHSSSDSSNCSSDSEEESSSQRSRSPSPETLSDPGTPTDVRAPRCPSEFLQTRHPSTTQWQLDEWLKKVRKKSSSCDQDLSEHSPGRRPPEPCRAPSPTRSWGTRRDYSPSQSPVSSPHFNYSPRQSPQTSPGYSLCLSPFTSPVPSPCPSPRASHSPSPRPLNPPRSPSPGLNHSSPQSPRPESLRPPTPPGIPTIPNHRPRIRPWIAPVPSAEPRTKRRHSPSPQPAPLPRSRPKHTPGPHVPTAKATPALRSEPNQGHKHRPRVSPNSSSRLHSRPGSKHKPTVAPKSQHLLTSGPRPKESNKVGHSSHASLNTSSTPRDKHLPVKDSSSVTNNTDGPSSTPNARPQFQHISRACSEPRPKVKQRENPAHPPKSLQKKAWYSERERDLENHLGTNAPTKPKDRKTEEKGECELETQAEREGERKEVRQKERQRESQGDRKHERQRDRQEEKKKDRQRDRQEERKEDRQKDRQGERKEDRERDRQGERKEDRQRERKEDRQGERKEDRQGERKEDRERERQEQRRLAQEQLVRRRWVQSSEEEEDVEEIRKRREEREREEERRRRRKEWQAVQPKQRPHTNSDPQRPPARTKRSRSNEAESESHPDPSPPPSPPSPVPIALPEDSSSSSSSSSESDSEPVLPPCVAKVPADSTSSQRPVPRRGHQGPGRHADSRPGVLYPRGTATLTPDPGQPSQGKQKLYTLVPFGRSEQATSSHRGLRNLVVQIDLSLLHRVPDTTTGTPLSSKRPPSVSSSSKQTAAMRHLYTPDTEGGDRRRKRKVDNGVPHRESKRSNLRTQSPPPAHATASRRQDPNSDTAHNGFLEDYLDSKRPLSPLSPLSDTADPLKLPVKPQQPASGPTDTPRGQPKIEGVGGSGKPPPDCESWGPSLQRSAGPRGTVPPHEPPQHAEYYMHEAKRMKHRADAMVDKLGKAVNYVDAALSFMECGKAMEDGPLEAKSPYTMYAETVELIRYAMRLKSHSGPGARQEDKQLAVLCFRCLALLYWQMFRLKKDHALKYSKALLDYFKSSAKSSTAPIIWSDTGKDAGGHPASLSPRSSGLTLGSPPGSSPTLISIPQRIHQMAANHLNITNSVLYSYEYWEVADSLARDNKEFFNYLNTLSGPLTLHSSIAHAVQYTRQALQWIRISAKVG